MMPAPRGNQFWMMRAKCGRDKIFKTPKQLWDAAVEYFEYADSQDLIEVDYRGSERVEIPHKPPYSIIGMCIFFGTHSQFLYTFKKSCSEDFLVVIARIEEIIYEQKFNGASCGFYNPLIMSRSLGLVEKSQIEHDVKLIDCLLDDETDE